MSAGETGGERYLVLGPLGEGGYGTVWRALDARLGAECALKRIPVTPGGPVEEVEAALAEARLLARLRHPHVVTVLDAFAEPGGQGSAGQVTVVMELARGSAAEWCRTHGAAPPRAVAEVVASLADALVAAHAQGIVHRDVKPANVLLFDGGRAKLGDFGVAHILASGRARTHTSAVKGTIAFMAPEQRSDTETVDRRADVYALGLTGLFLATGAVPREPYVEAEARRLAGLVPPVLLDPLLRACAWDAAARPDAATLRDAMRAVLLALPAGPGAEVLEDVEPAPVAEPAPPLGTVAPPAASAPAHRRGTSVAWTIALALGVGVAGAWWGARARDGERTAAPVEPALPVADVAPPRCADAPATWQESRKLGPRETIASRVADVDADGHLDLLFANQLEESVSVYFLDGTARMVPAVEVSSGRMGSAPAAGDLDGDGNGDLVVIGRDSAELFVLPGRVGSPRVPRAFAMREEDMQTGSPSWADLVDWDGDGVLDLMVQLEDCLAWRKGRGFRLAPASIGPGPNGAVPQQGRFHSPHECIDARARGGWAARASLPGLGEGVVAVRDGALQLLQRGKGVFVERRANLLADTKGLAFLTRAGPDGVADAIHVRAADSDEVRRLDGAGGIACTFTAPREAAGFADFDRDGVLDAFGQRTCAFCTSNHVLWKGLP